MISKFLFKIINKDDFDGIESSYDNLIIKYLLFLFFLFLFYTIFIIAFFGDMVIATGLIVITFFWLVLLLRRSKIVTYKRKSKILFIVILLIFIVSFFHIYTYKNAGVEYFYFSILFATPFFFKYKKDYTSVIIISSIISLNFIGCLYFNFDFLPKSRFFHQGDFKTVKVLNILFTVITFMMDIVFVRQKDHLIYGLMEDTKIKDSTIEDLMNTNNNLMIQQIKINHLTNENIQEIFCLAENNSPIFFDRFQVYFPYFIPDVLKINPNLIHSELYFCALMKLDFDTKKIAQCTNNSIRAVESKKYRIRKKLMISSDININTFIMKI